MHCSRPPSAEVKTYRPSIFTCRVTNLVGLPRANTPLEFGKPQGEVGCRLVVSPRFIEMGQVRVMEEATFKEAEECCKSSCSAMNRDIYI